YIRNGYYTEAMNVLNGIPTGQRTARWHYYAALASSGLGNNIRAQAEARTAVEMEPNNYEYQRLLDRLQNPSRSYTTYQQAYTQPGSRMQQGNFCLQAWPYLTACHPGRAGGQPVFFFQGFRASGAPPRGFPQRVGAPYSRTSLGSGTPAAKWSTASNTLLTMLATFTSV